MALQVFAQRISGYISDDTGAVLPNANIIVSENSMGTVSNQLGYYSFELEPGRYKITVSFLGYNTVSHNIVIHKGKDVTLNIAMQRSQFFTDEVEINARQNDGFNKIDAPVRIQTMDIDEIMRLPAANTGKLFNTVSGVDVKNEFGIFSSQTVVSLRGLGGSKQSGTLVVIDGSPVNKSESGSVNWNMIDKDGIEKIEIMKGPGSVMFGSNAMGGVINITTLKPRSALAADVFLSYGRFNTLETGFYASGRNKSNLIYWKLHAGAQRSNGYINTPDYLIQENDTIVSPVYLREYNVGGLFGFYLNEKNRIEVSANYYDDQRGTGIKIFEDMGAFDEHDTYHVFAKYRGVFGRCSVYSNLYFMNEFYGKLNEYYSNGEYKLYEVDSKRFDYGAKTWAEYNISGNIEALVGAELKTGSVDGKDVYFTSTDIISNRGKMNTLAGFAQSKWKISPQWLVYGGLRYDYSFFYDASFSIEMPSYSIEYLSDFQYTTVGSKHWSALNPKFTMQYSSENSLRWYVSVAGGFGAPLLEDLCRTGRKKIGFKIANPELKPEKITNFETGAEFNVFRNIELSTSLFFMRGNDFMYFITTGDSVNLGYTIVPVYRVDNISKVEIFGLEADAKAKLGKWLRLFTNYTYTHSQIKEYIINTPGADKDLTNKYLTDIPKHKFSAGISVATKPIHASVSVKYTGKRWLNDENKFDDIYLFSDTYPAYYTIDMKLWRQFNAFELSIEIDNLLNTIYTDSRGYRSPGIFYMGKIKYSINQ